MDEREGCRRQGSASSNGCVRLVRMSSESAAAKVALVPTERGLRKDRGVCLCASRVGNWAPGLEILHPGLPVNLVF